MSYGKYIRLETAVTNGAATPVKNPVLIVFSKPSTSLNSVPATAGATQLQWNPVNTLRTVRVI